MTDYVAQGFDISLFFRDDSLALRAALLVACCVSLVRVIPSGSRVHARTSTAAPIRPIGLTTLASS